MDQIVAHGEVKRGRIGIAVQDLSPDSGQTAALAHDQGAVLAAVDPGLSAARAGLAKGDVITSVDAVPIRSASHLRAVLGSKRAGTTVQIISHRKGTPRTHAIPIEALSSITPSARRQASPSG